MHTEKGNIVVVLAVLIAIAVAAYVFVGPERLQSLWNSISNQTPGETPGGTTGGNTGASGGIEPSTGKEDLIRVNTPGQNAIITSPLTIRGEARGYWFFEASFPVKLTDANGNNIPLEPGYMQAKGEWMTEAFVPFEGAYTFTAPATDTGTLVLMKDNPSGLPENDDALMIPVRFR